MTQYQLLLVGLALLGGPAIYTLARQAGHGYALSLVHAVLVELAMLVRVARMSSLALPIVLAVAAVIAAACVWCGSYAIVTRRVNR